MDGIKLQNLISKAQGQAGRQIGTPFIVYRPRARTDPLASRNRVIKLDAAFTGRAPNSGVAPGYGDPNWLGIFDTLYTQPGDYLSGRDGSGHMVTYFIAAQFPLLSAQCVKTNRTVRVLRPPAPSPGAYGGMVTELAICVIAGWPASLLAQNARVSGTLPETRYGMWSLLLPALPTDILVGDIVNDDDGRSFLTASAEESDLGWRLIIRQVAG